MFHVQPAALEQLRQRIEALGRRAARLGVEPVRLLDTEERDADGCALVVLRGDAPVLAGWTLAAIVEHHDTRANVRPVGEHGERLAPDAFATATCEHCLLRRRRNKTYVVVHADSGEVRQVGSRCLRDFLGGVDPERACRRAEHLALARAELKQASAPTLAGSSAVRAEPTVEEFAAHAARMVRAHGFTSREQAQHTSKPASADEALRSLEQTPAAPDRADRALADAALRWARELLAAKPDLSQFERDALAALSAGKIVTRRERGLVCALIAVYRRRRARSRHLADPGRRIEVTVLVERVVAQPSERHGTVRRCELIDADANRLVWWQTQGAALRSGEVITLIGRVQHHTRFGASPVTVLSHCRRRTFTPQWTLPAVDPVPDDRRHPGHARRTQMSAPDQTSPSVNGAGNLFVEADPAQRSAPPAPVRSGTVQRPRRGRGLVIPVDQTAGRPLPGPDAARFTRPGRGGRLAAGAQARLQAADARAAALLRRLADTRYGALVAAATLAAVLLGLSWVGLALRDASTARHSAERARTAAVAALTRDHTRIDALNTHLVTANANARRNQRASATARAATAAWRARAIAAEHKLALNRHRPRH